MKLIFANLAVVALCAFAVGDFASAQATTRPTTSPATSPAPTQLSAQETLQVLKTIQQKLGNVQSLQANFTEEKIIIGMFKSKLVLTGHYALQKPGSVIWVVDKPVRYAVRVIGSEVRQWDEDSKKVQTIDLGGDPTFKAISQQLQAWFLGDFDKLKGDFDAQVASQNPLTIQFKPKPGSMTASLMASIDVVFNKDVTNIDTMVIREADGNVSTIHSTDVRLNQPLGADVWEIPPK
jgi:outer membrane lipoprotein-sorting protein